MKGGLHLFLYLAQVRVQLEFGAAATELTPLLPPSASFKVKAYHAKIRMLNGSYQLAPNRLYINLQISVGV